MRDYKLPAAWHSRRLLFLTLDTDWCSEEVLQHALSLFQQHQLPCTVFATGKYKALHETDVSTVEVALHPNFDGLRPEDHEATLRELMRLYPQARGVGTHGMLISNPLLDLFRKNDLKYDRDILRYNNPDAVPFCHYNGLLRLPVNWEDDIWFTVEPGQQFSPARFQRRCFHYVFNFHPIHLYMNTETVQHYQSFKPLQHDGDRLATFVNHGYGTRSYFLDLVDYVRKHGIATGLLRDFLAGP